MLRKDSRVLHLLHLLMFSVTSPFSYPQLKTLFEKESLPVLTLKRVIKIELTASFQLSRSHAGFSAAWVWPLEARETAYESERERAEIFL